MQRIFHTGSVSDHTCGFGLHDRGQPSRPGHQPVLRRGYSAGEVWSPKGSRGNGQKIQFHDRPRRYRHLQRGPSGGAGQTSRGKDQDRSIWQGFRCDDCQCLGYRQYLWKDQAGGACDWWRGRNADYSDAEGERGHLQGRSGYFLV